MPALVVKNSRFLVAKTLVAKIITCDFVGWAIRFFHYGKIPHRGTTIIADGISLRNIASIYWGLYESAELRFISKYFHPSIDTIEFGSSLGVVSSFAGSRLVPGTRMFCVEANPDLLPMIERNLEQNAPHADFRVISGAIHYGSPTIRFSIGPTNLTSRLADAETSAQTRVCEVSAVALSEVVSLIDGGWFQLICDIEGAEVGLIKNDACSLERCALLVIETHEVTYQEQQYDTDDIIALLEGGTPLQLKERYGPVCVFSNRNFKAAS